MQLTLIVIPHTGTAGHKGYDATLDILRTKCIWKSMAQDIRIFIKVCIHCTGSRSGDRIPRPYLNTLHATRPNELVHFDFLYMGPSTTAIKHFLVIRDDLSSYLWLCPVTAADGPTTARELSRWIDTFTAMDLWGSDQGSHFKNQVMESLA